MKTEANLKDEFKVFFEKHPNIKELPFLMTIIIPKYESQGKRVVEGFRGLLEDEDIVREHLKAEYGDFDEFYKSFINDLPSISEKDAFYEFDENTLVIVKNNNGKVEIETLDYSEEIWEMW